MDQLIHPVAIFDSRELPARDAIDSWYEVAGQSFRIAIDRDHRNQFALTLLALRIGALVATSASTSAQTLDRNATCVRRDGIDQFGFFLQLTGSRAVRAGETETILRPGAVQFFDMAQEDCSIASEGVTATLYVPREVVEQDVPQAARLHGTVFQHLPARLLAHQLVGLFADGADFPNNMARYVERSMLSLAMGCLDTVTSEDAPSRPGVSSGETRRRIERYIEEHLQDHALDASKIVHDCGVSRSALYRMFQPHGGVHHYIRHRRLRRVRTILLADDEHTIKEIAFANGFLSQGQLSREFRQTFGVSPRDLRERHGDPEPTVSATTSLDQLFR
jgi:AraC-like DNA-binding protein